MATANLNRLEQGITRAFVRISLRGMSPPQPKGPHLTRGRFANSKVIWLTGRGHRFATLHLLPPPPKGSQGCRIFVQDLLGEIIGKTFPRQGLMIRLGQGSYQPKIRVQGSQAPR